ncbi:Iodotyrosine deiodinase 1 [Geodia barretti]|uniref:Iodotyrosine deiodinase 1 n=1 Tax=Geodia barretti TaxID=519541 RepID=A0AA35XA85_GEOBA|nr:Iodotyrosine deiodinase 1 [Geodia barretti]
MKGRAAAFYQQMDTRRSVRHFSSDPVPQEAIENIVLASGTSPSGAHSEPWTFVVVKDAEIKKRVREIVEQEEYLNYDRRMGDRWVRDIKFVPDHSRETVPRNGSVSDCGVALRELLGRPDNEKVMLLLPVGYPAHDATVLDLKRKTLDQIMITK